MIENILPIDIKLGLLLFLFFSQSDGNQERHYLRYEFTVMTKTESFPAFSAVCESDDKQIALYSNEERVWRRESLTDWTEAPGEPPEPRDWYLDQLSDLTNCTKSECSELHVLQGIVGCELEKFPNGTRKSLKSFNNYGYDGNDLPAFNSDTVKWIDKNPKAKETKDKWDRQTRQNQFIEYYLKTCSDWILTFNNTIKSSPDVHVFARKVPGDRSKLNLTCLATGFYPRDVQMNIRLNKTKLEDQTSSGIRPNADETFQMRISVKIDRNHEESYDCQVIHSSLTEPVTVNWDGKCSNCEPEPQLDVVGVVLGVFGLLCVFCLICYWICKRKKSHDPQTTSVHSYGSMDDHSVDVQPEDDQIKLEVQTPVKRISCDGLGCEQVYVH